MGMAKDEVDKYKVFFDLLNSSKKEVFRLQLLNSYYEDTRRKEFKDFESGKQIDYFKIPGINEWLNQLAEKRDHGVNIINLQVVDLPLKDGLKFGMGALRIAENYGQRSVFVERTLVGGVTDGLVDFYMFDSGYVLPIVYDKEKEGKFVEFGKPISGPLISKYTRVRDELMKVAVPIEEFLVKNKIELKAKQKRKN